MSPYLIPILLLISVPPTWDRHLLISFKKVEKRETTTVSSDSVLLRTEELKKIDAVDFTRKDGPQHLSIGERRSLTNQPQRRPDDNDEILRGSTVRNTPSSGSDNRTPLTPLGERRMNKKQLANLLAAIVLATQAHADNAAMDTTEDEARTMVGMALRKVSSQIVQDASGCDGEEAKVLLRAAQTTVADGIAAKKAEKKAKATS